MTNLILLLLISTNATFHWQRSPDLTVTGHVMHASPVSRFTNEKHAIQVSLPVLPGMQTNTLVLMRNSPVATNSNWRLTAESYVLGNVTNWTMVPDNTRRYFAVAAMDNTGVESDLSNEVLFDPRWAFIDFCIEGSSNLNDWEIMGRTNVLRFWCASMRSGNVPAFFRGRLVITNQPPRP